MAWQQVGRAETGTPKEHSPVQSPRAGLVSAESRGVAAPDSNAPEAFAFESAQATPIESH